MNSEPLGGDCGPHCGTDGNRAAAHCSGCHAQILHGNAAWAVPLGPGPGAWIPRRVIA